MPLSLTGSELLFEVLSQCYERGSTVVTSNLPFEDWTNGVEFILGGVLGDILGILLAVRLSVSKMALDRIFAVPVLIVAIYMIAANTPHTRQPAASVTICASA